MTTVYRQICGTHAGMLLHQANQEPPCGECLRGELLRKVAVEEWPSITRRRFGPVSHEQAARNLAALMAAMADEPDPAPVHPDSDTPETEETNTHG